MVTEGVTVFTQSPSLLAQIPAGSGGGDKGQVRRLQQSPVESGPARSGLGVAGMGTGATESGCLPKMRNLLGCPEFEASCWRPGKDFEEYGFRIISNDQARIGVFLSFHTHENPLSD